MKEEQEVVVKDTEKPVIEITGEELDENQAISLQELLAESLEYKHNK